MQSFAVNTFSTPDRAAHCLFVQYTQHTAAQGGRPAKITHSIYALIREKLTNQCYFLKPVRTGSTRDPPSAADFPRASGPLDTTRRCACPTPHEVGDSTRVHVPPVPGSLKAARPNDDGRSHGKVRTTAAVGRPGRRLIPILRPSHPSSFP